MSYHNKNDEHLGYSESSSEYDEEIHDVVGDFNAAIRTFSSSVKPNFVVTSNGINNRREYEQFDRDHSATTSNLDKILNNGRKIPQSLRKISLKYIF